VCVLSSITVSVVSLIELAVMTIGLGIAVWLVSSITVGVVFIELAVMTIDLGIAAVAIGLGIDVHGWSI